jgi:hypothetical protein
MANDEPAETSDYFIHSWRLSASIFKKPEHIADVVKRFGPQRPLATTLRRIIGKLRDPKEYAAAHHQPGGKSFERAFLLEPLLRLMKKFHAKPGQHGSFLGAIKSLHLAIGIDPPSEGAIKKMRHDLRQGERSKQGNGYSTAKKRPNA